MALRRLAKPAATIAVAAPKPMPIGEISMLGTVLPSFSDGLALRTACGRNAGANEGATKAVLPPTQAMVGVLLDL